MKTTFLLFFLSVAQSNLLSQNKVLETKVYFEKNKYEINEFDENIIDSFYEQLNNKTIIKVFIFGNTDKDADSLYNKHLSEKRTKEVKEYLIELGFDKTKIIENSFGEEKPINTSDEEKNKSLNRRVDIRVIFQNTIASKATNIDTTTIKNESKDSCNRDTTIILEDKTQIVFNICEYKEYQNCIDIQTANNSNDLLINGMSLSDTTGEPIASCGMIKIGLKPNSTKSNCLKYAVTVRFPVPDDKDCNVCGRNARVWGVGTNGRWSQNQGRNKKIRTIIVDGKKYYQLKIKCINSWSNCDCKKKYNKVKFLADGDYKILNLKILFNCPTALYETTKEKKKVTALLPCFVGEKSVIGTLISSKGDTLQLPLTSIDSLEKRVIFSKCKKIKKEVVKKWLGIFPLAKRELYRKYIIPERLLKSSP